MLLMVWYAHGEDPEDVPEEVFKFALKNAAHSRNANFFVRIRHLNRSPLFDLPYPTNVLESWTSISWNFVGA